MPATAALPQIEIQNRLAALERQVRELQNSTGTTVANAAEEPQVAIGNLLPTTGLSGFGLAVHRAASTGAGTAAGWINIGERLKPKVMLAHNEITMPNKAAGEFQKLALGVEAEVDTEAWWVKAENHWVPKVPGFYIAGAIFTGTVGAAAGTFVDIGVGRNDTEVAFEAPARLESSIGTVGVQGDMTGLFLLNGTTDSLCAIGNSTMAAHKGFVTLWAALIA